jgi:hypothetical protein
MAFQLACTNFRSVEDFSALIVAMPDRNSGSSASVPRMHAEVARRAPSHLKAPFQSRTLLRMTGPGLGHDYLAHHRRVPIDSPNAKQIGIRANANRYASDLVIVNDKGEMWHDDPYRKENYDLYGAPIYAPASGDVAASRNDLPNDFEGRHIQQPRLPSDADEDPGNFDASGK